MFKTQSTRFKCDRFWLAVCAAGFLLITCTEVSGEILNGRIVDAESGKPVAARVYLQNSDGEWLFVETASSDGSALRYQEEWVPMPDSVELHTTVSAHPFQVELAPGKYTLTIERGKEYLPLTTVIEMGNADQQREWRLHRLVDMAARGWYSGETHVHRRFRELPNVMLAEDLNVAFPVTYWTTESDRIPDLKPSTLRRQGPSPFGDRIDRGYEPLAVDSTHIIFPRNTEYEIFSVGDKRHVLGAVFILNHQTVFQDTMPPVSKIAKLAHEEGALLDLDKHSWPWSMMLVPVAGVDLYELSNNSVWRTQFGFRRSSVAPANYMNVEMDEGGMTELGWLQYGFENYYALLNCGFELKPTAGTASGVHPVPLGYSRVYVHVEGEFSPESWLNGLRNGRSFVTTGPLLKATVQGKHAGHRFIQPTTEKRSYRIDLSCHSADPIERFEVLVNGLVTHTVEAMSKSDKNRGQSMELEIDVPIEGTCWVAIRCLAKTPEGRIRFAHTAPWYFQVADQPLLPRREQIDYLIDRMETEVDRNREVLNKEALAEFEQALQVYRDIGAKVKD